MSMRVYQNGVGKWCKFIHEDKLRTGIVTSGGQDKRVGGGLYRMVAIFTPEDAGVCLTDWPDIKSIGPAAKPPRF